MPIIQSDKTKNENFSNASPFIKWAGGKSQLLPDIRSRLPKSFKRYIEPFLGGGAVFLDLAPQEAVLTDANEELINCFKMVRDKPEELLRSISRLTISEEEYYRIRSLDPSKLSRVYRAARFIYLNKTCFNGLYRVNKSGKFNVPFGKIKFCNLANPLIIARANKVLKKAKLLVADYLETLEKFAHKGDFVYLDPPYLPIGKNSDFKRYTKNFFYQEDHDNLAAMCKVLHKRDCKFLLSNSSHPYIIYLYSGFNIEKVKANRFINCHGDKRGKIDELIVTNY